MPKDHSSVHVDVDGLRDQFRIVSIKRLGVLPRTEPFRGLLDKAFQAEPEPASLALVRSVPEATASPAPIPDHEEQYCALERRLDAVVLAAGATPPQDLRTSAVAPGFLSSTQSTFAGAKARNPDITTAPVRVLPRSEKNTEPDSSEVKRPGSLAFSPPTPRVLQFLPDDMGTPSEADTSSRRLRLGPVTDARGSADPHTNVYRLTSSQDESSPSRPLPACAASVPTDSDAPVTAETAVIRRRDKVVSFKNADRLGFALRSFSSSDLVKFEAELVAPPRGDSSAAGRQGRAVTAVALPGLCDEDVGELGDIDDVAGLGTMEDLDDLARDLGLQACAVSPVDCGADALAEVPADDIDLVDVERPLDPFAAVLDAGFDLIDDGDHTDDFNDDLEVTAPRAVAGGCRLPSSLFRDMPDGADNDDFDDFDIDSAISTVKVRPAPLASQAVRFSVSNAPARPRHATLTAEQETRNKSRARVLYLVALDDLGNSDPDGAMVHLELAIAFDDSSPLYVDLLQQLKDKKNKH